MAQFPGREGVVRMVNGRVPAEPLVFVNSFMLADIQNAWGELSKDGKPLDLAIHLDALSDEAYTLNQLEGFDAHDINWNI